MNLEAVNDFVGKDWVYLKNDCWTVFCEASEAVFGVKIVQIDHPERSNAALNRKLFEARSLDKEWRKIESPLPGCAVLFRDHKRRVVHIGLHVIDGNVLHCPGDPDNPGRTVYETLKALKQVYKSMEFHEYLPDCNS